MSWIQNGKTRNPEKPIPGCLGRMVNLFDLNTVVGGNRLLTDKPHHDGSSFSRRQSDVTRTSLVDNQMDDKVMVSELRKSPSNKKSNGTPIKMLIAQEMSKEEDCKQSPSNLVAKLMGLDALPQQHQPGSASCRSHMRELRSQSGSFDLHQAKHEISQYPEQGEYKDVYEIWQQQCEPERVRDDSPRKGRCSERQSESKMALVREKFMEAKRLSTDEKLRQSKQFQDALEVLSSNKDLFLKFLQEPNSLFSQHLYGLESVPPPPVSRRITVLRPSKLVESHKIIGSGKKNEKQVKEPGQLGCKKAWDKSSSDFLFSSECCKIDDNPIQPTRIVVLKPSSGKPHNIKVVASPPSSSRGTSHDEVFDGDPEDSEALASREVAGEIAHEISDNLSGLRRDETLLSSVFSNGYIGDDSSFGKSEIDYAAGNLSDSEVVSPTCRHSWDYINRFNSPYSTSSSRASYSPESSVCREAKKRLSERWAMMASNKNVQEQRQIQRSSSTLGDMLALSDLKKSVNSEENCKSKEESRGSLSFLTSDLNKTEDTDNSPRNLPRSKSVPATATSSSSRLGVEVSGSLKGKADDTKDVVKEKLVKSSSFKGRVSSLFFSKNKKSTKEKSPQSKDVPQSARFPIHSPRNVGNDGSQCINDTIVEDESCTRLHRSLRKAYDQGSSDAGVKQGIILPKAGLKPEIPGNHSENQDQPSPISVLEPQFEEDDHSKDCHRNPKLNEHGIEPMRYNLIDKSPPIGSISRTLSWDDSALGSSTPYAGKPSLSPLDPAEEEQECFFYIQCLLTVAGLNGKVRSSSFLGKWHSPESPLDPSLRDKYMNLSEKEPMLIQTKRRHHSAMTTLVFDCVNEVLMDIAGRGPCSESHSSLEDMASMSLVDSVWAQMKEWILGEERCDWEDGDGGSLVVEMVVRKEVVGRGWVEGLRLEIDDTRKEIEAKLVEELVEECVLELTGRG